MSSKLQKNNTLQLTDWQLFTNNGSFSNPVPPSRRLRKRSPYFLLEIDPNYVRSRCRTARSRNQSAISVSTQRVLSARSVNYRRPTRVKPIELDLDEESDVLNTYQSPRVLTAVSQRSDLSAPQAWSFSHLHRAIIAIDEQAKKDYEVGRTMNALAAWQNALVFCDELSQRTQLWPENKAALDEEIAALRNTYKHHMEETMRKNKHLQQGHVFHVPTRKCATCQTDQIVDQFHERFSTVCQHVERTVCNKCIDNLAKTLRRTPNKTEFNCPETHCKAKLNLKQVRQILGTNTNTTTTGNVHHQSKSHSVERKTEFIHCAHEGCGSGQFFVPNPNTAPIVTCILCKRQTCAVHGIKWHKGMTCTQYDQHQIFIRNNKTCPTCQVDMERNPDENHVLCSRCNTEYCWECMADYRKIQRHGPQHHTTACPYYVQPSQQQTSKSSACIIL